MKKMFQAVVLLMAVTLLALVVTAQAETSETCGKNLTWVLDDAGTLTISGSGEMWDYIIGATTGSWGTGVKAVVIQDGVTSIGWNAFDSCGQLASVVIPDSVTAIGISAFYGCRSLAGISIPEGVTEIEDYTFWG